MNATHTNQEKTMSKELRELVAAYNASGRLGLYQLIDLWRRSGRVAHILPRKRLVSLSGHRAISFEDAEAELKDWIDRA